MSELKPEQLLELMKGEILNFRGVQWMLNGEAMPFTLQSLTRVANIALKAASTIPASEANECAAFAEAASIAEGFGPSRPLATERLSDLIRGRWEGEQAASSNIARLIRERAALASTRTASDTRTAAGEAECDAALGRVAPAGQHGAGASAWTDREIDVFTWQVHPDCRATARSLRELVRAVEAKLASRGAAQGRITCKESVTSNSAKNGTESPETRMDTGSRTDVNSAAQVDVEAERKLCEAWHGGRYQGLQADIALAAWLAARTQADAGRALYSTRQDAERFRRAIALEDNAETLHAAVMNHAPDGNAIRAEFDASTTKPENT